jgi:hypothetical protein
VSFTITVVFASEVILVSETSGTNDHNILPLIQDFPIIEGHVPVFTSPRNSMIQLYPQALGSFSSPLLRATAEVFHPPQHKINTSEVEVEVILLTMVSRCRAPIWGPRPGFYYCRTFAVLPDERRGL